MTSRRKGTQIRLTLLLSTFLVLVGFLAHAGACLYPESTSSVMARINSCHSIAVETPCPQTCCKSEACHSTMPAPRDLGGPSYQTERDASHPIVHDPRTTAALYRIDTVIPQSPPAQPPAISGRQISDLPNQTLSQLKTVILRH